MGNEVARVFWKRSNGQSFGTTLATDPAFEELNRQELAEIGAQLPPLDGANVLELGGGIGRFTSLLAASAAKVTVLDISPEAIESNRARNARFGNVRYEVSDITAHDLGMRTYDFAFCNWLLMYLDDSDARDLLERVARSLRPAGMLFVRESCGTNYRSRSYLQHILTKDLLLAFLPPMPTLLPMTYNFWLFRGNPLLKLRWMARCDSLQNYRKPETYEDWFRDSFEVAASGYVEAYERRYGNANQRYWLLKRAKVQP
jgi:2-polyprenyl-3-methyl-5-hydroxy-6-metoxy-1,4-benzoquinol methylase